MKNMNKVDKKFFALVDEVKRLSFDELFKRIKLIDFQLMVLVSHHIVVRIFRNNDHILIIFSCNNHSSVYALILLVLPVITPLILQIQGSHNLSETRMTVNGPSFTRLTSISAPKRPVCTSVPDFLHSEMIYP